MPAFDCTVCPECSVGMPSAEIPTHACKAPGLPAEPKDKGGRPKGFDGHKSKMPSAMAQKFKQAGLDWQVDFALAIKRASNYDLTKADRNEARERISLWLRLLPYLITTSAKSNRKKWKGKPSKAALLALQTLEGK